MFFVRLMLFTDGKGTNTYISLAISPDQSLGKAGRLQIVKCSLSMLDHVDCRRLPRSSTKSTNRSMSLNRRSSSQISYWILVYRPLSVFDSPLTRSDAYDVNVSPDKRTILLHDQGTLLENLRVSMINQSIHGPRLTFIDLVDQSVRKGRSNGATHSTIVAEASIIQTAYHPA